MLDKIKKEKDNVQDHDFWVTHCLEASESKLEHCLYLSMQSFLWGKGVSETTWLVSSFSMLRPTYQGELVAFLCFQCMEIGLCQKRMRVSKKEKSLSSLQILGTEM